MKILRILLIITSCFIAPVSAAQPTPAPAARLMILGDNAVARDGVKAVWGFACLVEARGHTVLFDTGADPGVLKDNLTALKITPSRIEAVVISHYHADHTCGAPGLGTLPGVRVFIPRSFEGHPKESAALQSVGLTLVPVSQATPLFDGIAVSEPLHFEGRIPFGASGQEFTDELWEQCLTVETPAGLIVIAGCSHAGILPMLEQVKRQTGRPLHLVLGGFHLLGQSDTEVRRIAEGMQTLGVAHVSATHCTGAAAARVFRDVFRDRYVSAGAGAVIDLPLAAPATTPAPPPPGRPPMPHQSLARDIFRELVEIDTTATTGDTARAAEAMAARLRAGGLPTGDVHVFKPAPRKGNLVAHLRGTGARRPVLFMAHLDVVEAPREGWSFDPFKLTEQDGYFYGRGTSDDKCGAVALVAMLIRLQQEGYRPNRDIIIVLETDEETTGDGIKWLLQNQRELLDAEYAVNEDGGFGMQDGRLVAMEFQASEKLYQSYWLQVRHPGGLSSLPPKDTAIYRLAAGLTRLAQLEFPARLNETTRAYFERMASLQDGQLALDMKAVSQPEPDPAAIARLSANPLYNALLRTTCVATRLEAGHADNALPQTARALVNCRILPGEALAEVRQAIIRTLADDGITVTAVEEAMPSPPSPLNPEVLHAVERVTAQLWPGAPVIPTMAVWATDGMFLRNAGIPTYCLDGFARDQVDVREREHGQDERLLVKSFYEGLEFNHRLVKVLSGGERPEPVLPTQ